MERQSRSRWLGRLSGLMVIVFALSWLLPNQAHAAPAHALKITSFYTTTKAAYDKWPKTHFKPPVKVAKFPASTTIVAYYWSYKGAAAKKDHFQVVVRYKGKIVFTGKSDPFPYATGSEMYYITAAHQKPFAAGTYRVTLRVDGKAAGTISYTVGK